MDILSHMVAGAASGAVFGHPVVGAVIGALPDVVLGIKRKAAPNTPYRATHSLLVLLLVLTLLAALPFNLLAAIALAWLSHIVLDVPTHGQLWAPRVLFPLYDVRIGNFQEWEFFTRTWYNGLCLTVAWSAICLLNAK